MRLVTWNCCHGNLAPKRAVTRALGPDVLVLQECARDRADSDVYRWFGDHPKKKGVAVVCADGWKLEAVERARAVPRWTIPLRVHGPVDFLLFAVWTKSHRQYPYIEVLHRALVRRFDHIGVASAYHSFFAEAHGQETRNTYHFLWKEHAAYHVDYCFVPRAWTIDGVSIGSYADYRKLSDHRPLIVDIANGS